MPQLDLITFIDQTFYVYLFFIFQYIIISVFVLPGIYQSLILKRFLYETVLSDIQLNIFLFKNLLTSFNTLEQQFVSKTDI